MSEFKYKDDSDLPGFFLNPGAGQVIGDTGEGDAVANVHVLCQDLSARGNTNTTWREIRDDKGDIKQDGDGRWLFDVNSNGRSYTVEMPGLPIDEVRFLDLEGQNIWDFPRLYVDGDSWVWKYAIKQWDGES